MEESLPSIEEPVVPPASQEGDVGPPAQLGLLFVEEVHTPAGKPLDRQPRPGRQAAALEAPPHGPRFSEGKPSRRNAVSRDAAIPDRPSNAPRVDGKMVPVAGLASAFGVRFAMPPGSNQVVLNKAGEVVEGHLKVFAAGPVGDVRASIREIDDVAKANAASSEFCQTRAVALQAQPLLGQAAHLGVKIG